MLVPLGEPNGRTRWEVSHGGRRFLVLVHRDSFVVIDALCPHKHGQLSAGVVRDDAIVCSSHWYAFDLATGTCRNGTGYTLGRYDVIERDGVHYAELPSRPRRSWRDVLRARRR